MAVGEILAKGLVVIKGDTSHARAEIAKLSAEEQKAAKARIKAQEENNASLERSNQRFQLYVAGAVAGWAIVSKSLKTYETHLKSLGASGEAELKRLQGASKALDDSQKNLEIAIGRVAAQAAPAALALADMANELANIVAGIGGVVSMARNLPGGGVIGKGLGYAIKYGGPVNQARALGSLAVTGIGTVYDNIRGTASVSDNFSSIDGPSDVNQYLYGKDAQAGWSRLTGKSSNSQSLLGEEGKQAIQYIDQESGRLLARSLKGKAELFFKNAGRGLGLVESQRGGGGGGKGVTRETPDIYGFDNWGRMLGETYDSLGIGNLTEAFGPTETTHERDPIYKAREGLAELAEQARGFSKQLEEDLAQGEKSAIEKIVGPIEDLDAYATGFTMLSDAATSAYEAIVTGAESAGAAIKRVIGGEVMALGKSMLVHSLQEGAWAIADLARGNLPGAATHGKAAAAFLAGSVAAGAVAAGLGVGGGGGGGGRGNSYAAAGLGGGGGGEPARNANLTVVMGDGFADDSPRYKARRVRRAIGQARNLYPESGATEPN